VSDTPRAPTDVPPQRAALPGTPALPVTATRVVRTLRPSARGSGRWSRQFGAALVCVRHRIDASATLRITTVELVVAEQPIQPKPSPLVAIHLRHDERTLRMRAVAAGAQWDPIHKLWLLRRATATTLGLHHRIRPLPK
jgi:hypothetical protein